MIPVQHIKLDSLMISTELDVWKCISVVKLLSWLEWSTRIRIITLGLSSTCWAMHRMPGLGLLYLVHHATKTISPCPHRCLWESAQSESRPVKATTKGPKRTPNSFLHHQLDELVV